MMKHCDNCRMDFNTLETQCPVCGGLREADGTADDIAALMLLLGLLLLVVFLY